MCRVEWGVMYCRVGVIFYFSFSILPPISADPGNGVGEEWSVLQTPGALAAHQSISSLYMRHLL